MSFLTNLDLRTALENAVRSDGRAGLTTAQDLRTFLGLILSELEAEALRTPPSAADLVHRTGDESIAGVKTFTGDVLVGNGQDGSGLKIRQPSGPGYMRLLDVTNTDRPNSINFGAVGEGGDLRYHGTDHRWVANSGGPARMLLDAQSNLAVTGQVRAAAFVGDGSQLTNLPTGPRCTATGLAKTEFIGTAQKPVTLHFTKVTGTGYNPDTGRFTPGKAGFYGITMGVQLSATGDGEMYLGLIVNSNRYVTIQHWQVIAASTKAGGTGYVEVELGADDSAEVVFLNDNGDQTYWVFDNDFQTFFSARWLGV